MTRATSTGERFAPGGFGDADRGLVWRLTPGIWEGNRPDEGAGPQFPTWREAMDYALGLDTPSGTP